MHIIIDIQVKHRGLNIIFHISLGSTKNRQTTIYSAKSLIQKGKLKCKNLLILSITINEEVALCINNIHTQFPNI